MSCLSCSMVLRGDVARRPPTTRYTVLLSSFRRYFKLASYLSTHTAESIVIAMGVPSLKASRSPCRNPPHPPPPPPHTAAAVPRGPPAAPAVLPTAGTALSSFRIILLFTAWLHWGCGGACRCSRLPLELR